MTKRTYTIKLTKEQFDALQLAIEQRLQETPTDEALNAAADRLRKARWAANDRKRSTG